MALAASGTATTPRPWTNTLTGPSRTRASFISPTADSPTKAPNREEHDLLGAVNGGAFNKGGGPRVRAGRCSQDLIRPIPGTTRHWKHPTTAAKVAAAPQARINVAELTVPERRRHQTPAPSAPPKADHC